MMKIPAIQVLLLIGSLTAYTANAAITLTLDTVANTATLAVTDGDWITALNNSGAGLWRASDGVSTGPNLAATSVTVSMTAGAVNWTEPLGMQLIITGGGTSVNGVQLVGSTGSVPYQWAGTVVGTFSNLSSTLVNGSTLTTNLFGSQSSVGTAQIIPEPATYAALFGAVALAFALARRRRK
jgi:hypothetical protein